MINIFCPKIPYSGEDPESQFFCGDIIKEKTKYVRMWGTTDINTLKFNPSMPYHDSKKPYINYWFSFSEGHTARVFNKLLQDQNIEKLTRERGATIVYTHFSSGFIKKSSNGEYILNPVAKTQLMKLAKQKDGWFVTTSTLLDRLLLMKNVILYDTEQALIVSNVNVSLVPGLTILTKPDSTYYDWEGNPLISNEEGEIVIGVINGHSSAVLYKNDKILFAEDVVPNFDTEQALIVTNVNVTNVPDVTILVKPASTFYDWEGNPLISNEEGEIVIGDLTGRSSAVLYKNDKILFAKDAVPHWHEKTSLVLNRILVWIKTKLDF
jgi:hypothetical protein